jgi:hypothetical protein
MLERRQDCSEEEQSTSTKMPDLTLQEQLRLSKVVDRLPFSAKEEHKRGCPKWREQILLSFSFGTYRQFALL